MRFEDIAIPAGFLWSSPFCRWQGSLAGVSSLDVAAAVTTKALADRGLPAGEIDSVTLGWTVPQIDIFYGAPLLAARIGAEGRTGPMVSQACATSAAALTQAAAAVAATPSGSVQLVVAADRCSNGPLLVYPDAAGQGGAPQTEHWVLDNFSCDPWAGTAMIDAAETVASEGGFTRAETDELKALRYEQYAAALADDRAFQRRYMVPVVIPGRKGDLVVETDEGIRPATVEGISGLKPASGGGVHTFATQTHPADGCAGAVVTRVERARELSDGNGVVRILAAGTARVERTHMPQAPVPAARAALTDAGLDIDAMDAITTHNPFAVNDLYFAKEMGVKVEDMNRFGSSLVFGHPQGPTGLRSMAELAEELRARGGGKGLFTGCAAGDTAMAVVLSVED